MHVEIKIQRLDDKEPLLDIEMRDEVVQLRLVKVGILEAGMKSGRASLALILEDGQGRIYTAECTPDIWHNIDRAREGAEQHWRENPGRAGGFGPTDDIPLPGLHS